MQHTASHTTDNSWSKMVTHIIDNFISLTLLTWQQERYPTWRKLTKCYFSWAL